MRTKKKQKLIPLQITLFINPSSITELLMLLNSSNSASTSLTLTEESRNSKTVGSLSIDIKINKKI